MDLILVFSEALLLSVVSIPLLMRGADYLQLVDNPTQARKLHTGGVPRIGGLAIVFGVFFSVSLRLKPDDYLLALFLSSAIIVLFGCLDDRFDLNAGWKLLGQILAVIVLLVGGVVIDSVPFMGLESAPVWLSYPLTFVFMLGAINAVNLSDGLDGLAAGIILLSLGLIAIWGIQINHYAIVLISFAMMGGILGFLRYNTFPALVFMGDTGSQFLGLMAVSLAILVTQDQHSALSPVLPLLVLGLPMLDTFMVMSIRCARHRPLFQADNAHIHYQLTKIGFTHSEAVAVLYLLQAVLLAIAWQFRYTSDLMVLFYYVIFCLTIVGAIGLARYSGWQLHKPLTSLDLKERRNAKLRKLNWVHSYSSQILEAATAALLLITALVISINDTDISKLSLGAVSICVFAWLACWRWKVVATRIVFYTSSITLMYGLLGSFDNQPITNLVIDICLVVMVLFLFLAIRMTRKELFRLDNQDYLVLFIICVIPFLPLPDLQGVEIARINLRLVALLYVCEYLLGKNPANNTLIKGAAIASMALLAAPSYAL
jgi:UDP-GlcNAc:undecaprenyl-phosphate/decaprenyl-phosphate GlcNAc-1-phosphate transferase